MTVKKTKISLINQYQNKIITSLFITLGIVSLFFTSLVGLVSIQNAPTKSSQAVGVYQCATGETLSATNCLSPAITSPIYTEVCEPGYTSMDSVCVTYTQKTCSDYDEAVIDPVDSSLCKIGNINRVNLSEIIDNDGRQCKGNGYNFKRYNVNLTLNSSSGPVVCANTFTAVAGKENFRFVPRNILSIKNFITSQTGSTAPACPAGYSVITSQCSIPAKVTNCSSAGEYLDSATSTCKPCPENKYCLNSTTGETTTSICPNGGTLTSNLCIAANKIANTTYTDGCTSTYVRFYKTCAIEEVRTHDLGCSYFYASTKNNIVAVLDSDLIHCSTGGRTDFADGDIVKVSDFECNGPGSGWYNYNVAFDPLVCGNSYDPNNKAAFRWLEKTFIKIVGLQKIGLASSICPSSWTVIANSNNCSQPPVVQRFALVGDCPVGSFSPAGSIQASNCVGPQVSSSSLISSSIISSPISSVPVSSILSSRLSSSSPNNTNGGGVIVINAQVSSSFNLVSSSAIESSSSKIVCVLKTNEYRENNECKPCPVGTFVSSLNSISIRDCITAAIIDKPTIRSGGLKIIDFVIFCSVLFSSLILFSKIKSHNKEFLSGWFRIKNN
jgi:hypothetical protein